MPKVVTTNWPLEEPREVSEQEAIDLKHQGLLVPGKGDIDDEGRLPGTDGYSLTGAPTPSEEGAAELVDPDPPTTEDEEAPQEVAPESPTPDEAPKHRTSKTKEA